MDCEGLFNTNNYFVFDAEKLLALVVSATLGLSCLRSKRRAMKPYHMRVHAFGVNRVAADLAGHIARRVCNRLLQWLSF